MKLTIENTIEIGKPCAIFDADGKKVMRCITCDTETGVIEQHAHNGKSFALEKNGKIEIIRETRPAPLRLEWL